MKRIRVSIPWAEGLHMRPAAALVRAASAHKSSILLRVGGKAADACNIFAIMLLSAGFGTVVDVEASGEDEELALNSMVELFETETSYKSPKGKTTCDETFHFEQ